MNKKIVIYSVIILVVISATVFYFLNLSHKSSMQTNQEQMPTAQVPSIPSTTPPAVVPPAKTPEVISAKTYNVSVVNFSFNPGVLTVNKGDTVVWTNQDPVAHQIAGGSFNGPVMSKNQSYTFVFNNTGTFDYHCAIHPSMKGMIIVK